MPFPIPYPITPPTCPLSSCLDTELCDFSRKFWDSLPPDFPQKAPLLKLSLGITLPLCQGQGGRGREIAAQGQSGAERMLFPRKARGAPTPSRSSVRAGSFLNSISCASAASPILSSALGSIFSKWDLPVFTLPFNIMVTLYLAATGPYNLFFPTTLLQPASSVPNITWSEVQVPLVGTVEGGRQQTQC